MIPPSNSGINKAPDLSVKGKYKEGTLGLGPKELAVAKETLLKLPSNNMNEIAVPVFNDQKKGGDLLGVALISKDNIEAIPNQGRLKKDDFTVRTTFLETNPDASFKNTRVFNQSFKLKDLLAPVILAKTSFDEAVAALPIDSVMKQQEFAERTSRDIPMTVIPSNSVIPRNVTGEGTAEQNRNYKITTNEASMIEKAINKLIKTFKNAEDPNLNDPEFLQNSINLELKKLANRSDLYDNLEAKGQITPNQANALRDSLDNFTKNRAPTGFGARKVSGY